MEHVALDDVEPSLSGNGVVRRGLSGPLGTTDVAINRYRIPPGEGFPGGLHAHADQEEVFVVIEGEATFETMAGEVTVDEGAAVRFAPGEFQSGRNDADGDLVAVAMGAPRDTEDVRIPLGCPECPSEGLRLVTDEGELKLVCPDCGVERVPRACPECGHDDMRVTLGVRRQPIVVCQGCGAEFEDPPLRD